MLSPFLNLELMHNNQVGKEIIFNESIIQIEQLCSQMVLGFIDQPHKELKKGLYIISNSGDRYHNHLSYLLLDSWRYIPPQENMIFFIKEEKAFFKFQENSWHKISQEHSSESSTYISTQTKESKKLEYIGVSDKYIVPIDQDFLHLYVNDNLTIEINNHQSAKITLLIKQNYQKKCKIIWADNIIFQQKAEDLEINRLMVITLYKTPEDDRYLTHISGIYSYSHFT